MDDFVCGKLNQWGLSEWIERFKEQDIDKESLYYLENQDIDSLIPKVGPRVKFKRNLELLKREEQNVNEGTEDLSVPHPQHHEDIIHLTEAGPSTSDNGKRKWDSQGESPTKRQRDESEAMMLTDVKTVMRNVYVRLRNQDNTKLNTFLKTKINDLETDKRELVGVFGRTGAGKSSLINAVIGEKKLLPTGSVSACTSVMIKVEANRHNNQKYEADIEFITEEEWKDEVWSINQLNVDNPDSETKSDHDDDHHDIVEKLSALYGDEWKEKTPENLLDNKYFNEIPEFLESRKKTLICDSAQELSAQFVKYTRNDTKQGEGKEVKRWYWPLVKCVTIRVPKNNLLQHVTIVDLPGNGDRNKSRDEMWKGIVGSCSAVWIVAGIDRAASERESWEILKNVSGLIGNGGECQQIHFICTKSDDIEDLDDRSVDDVRACIFKRNKEAKEAVLQEFDKLHAIKKHFGDDSFKVFTVSSREFLNGRRLNKESTEIPKLQKFLKNLNDCHSETLNYVSGAHGILSLIQGASCGGATGQKTVVCEHITKKINDQLCPTSEAMLKAYRAFEKCLSEGVETSKHSCERSLKFFLYPRKSGSAFYRKLKGVVNNDGIYQPKKGKQLNLNLTLASFLTGSIDEEFRKTFPNEGKHGPFFGVINAFTLDTEGLIQQYNDVKLQLIFLKTEEEKLKTKLKREIRDRKKTIYHSLMETIEKSMQDCYERAAQFSGPGSLLNMRHTIERHVSESKNIMFDQAKKVMLNQLINLMRYIIITLEETMRESTELSLKTDDNSIPDVSTELTMVAKLFDELKRIPEEEMS